MKNLLFLIIAFNFFSCVKDKPPISQPKDVHFSNSKKVFVVNEGNFGSGNSSVSLIDQETSEVVEDIYNTQNSKRLGDVAQSLSSINGKFYSVVNNSGKIIVCDQSFKHLSEITALPSPRYILAVTQKKAYVTDFHANGLHIVDLNNNTKVGSISCKGWPEKMVMIYNKVFVTNMFSNYLYVINTLTDLIEDSVLVGPNAGSILIDKDEKIWVLSSGKESENVKATITKINSKTNSMEKKFVLNANFVSNLCANGRGDTLYFLNQGVCRFSLDQDPSSISPIIAAASHNFYGLGVDPNNSKIYVSDALDYTQRSAVYVYNVDGVLHKTYKTGINSNSFYFE